MTSNVDGNVDTPEAPPQARFATLGEVHAYDEGCHLAARSLGEAAAKLVKRSKPFWDEEFIDSIISSALWVVRPESFYTPDEVRAFRLGVEETFVAMRNLAQAIQVAYQPGTVVHVPLERLPLGMDIANRLSEEGITSSRRLVALTKPQLGVILGGNEVLINHVLNVLAGRSMSLADG